MSNNECQKMILNVLGTRPIAFNADLAHALGSAKAGLFLSQLLFWYGKGKNPDWIWKTITEVKKETALSRSEQDTAIKICKKYDIIKVERKGIPAKRHFQLNIEKIVELLKTYYSGLSENDKQDCKKGAIKIEPKKQSNTENTNIKNNKEVSLTKKEQEWFDTFWETYPRKAAKTKTIKAWNKVDLTQEVFEAIMAALEKQKKMPQWTKDDGQFIPYPATWLNQERWNDQLTIPSGKVAPGKYDNIKSIKL